MKLELDLNKEELEQLIFLLEDRIYCWGDSRDISILKKVKEQIKQ